jgi:hypothetical protein
MPPVSPDQRTHPTSAEATATARDLWHLLEPIHAVTYFSPEPLAALAEAGYRGFWMGYFAGRAAPLGPASAELVHGVFYNFSLEHIARSLPDAWSFAPPEAALDARLAGSVAALRRHLGIADGGPQTRRSAAAGHGGATQTSAGAAYLERAATLLLSAALSAPPEGRALFAANLAHPAPDEPLARLWYAATLLREHRGDGHNAALAVAGLAGREAIVLHAISSGTPHVVYRVARRFEDAEWDAVTARLRERGLLDANNGMTPEGQDVRRKVEDMTDRLASAAYARLDRDALQELAGALRPIAAAVIASGELPRRSPVGIDLSRTEVLLGRGPAERP